MRSIQPQTQKYDPKTSQPRPRKYQSENIEETKKNHENHEAQKLPRQKRWKNQEKP